MLNIVVVATFICWILLCAGLLACSRFSLYTSTNTNPQFLDFQKLYFLAFLPALLGDWLNAPYLYKLFADYGFLEEQIAIIYVCGLASALIFGIPSGYLIERFGVSKLSLGASLGYCLSCFLKLSSDYSTLIISRILSGASTTLLFAAYENWYTRGHLDKHDFPKEWIDLTSTKSAFASSSIAASAGVIAYFMTELYGLGPVAPSLLAVPFLLLSTYMTHTHWRKSEAIDREQESPISNVVPAQNLKTPRFAKTCCEALQNIVRHPDLLVIGCLQSLFESVLCIFVFLWTPVLDHHNPPLGIVFASFMSATLSGSIAYKVVNNVLKLSPTTILTGTLAVACLAIFGCVMATKSTNEFPIVSYFSFLLFEMAAGSYFPVMSKIKRMVKPELQNFAITAWFRVPLNLFACGGLLMLHHSHNVNGTLHLFTVCLGMVATATLMSVHLHRTLKSELQQERDSGVVNLSVM